MMMILGHEIVLYGIMGIVSSYIHTEFLFFLMVAAANPRTLIKGIPPATVLNF